MPSAPVPPNEPQRLATLRALEVLDTPPEATFDRLTRIACRTFGVPIALISLVDESRQWCKSHQGLDVSQTPRSDAFCAHTILTPGLTLIPDARTDPRVSDSRLVTGAPGIRFYAGMPLVVSNGLPVGAFCVIDMQPREWDHADDATLADFAMSEMEAIERRIAMRRSIAAVHAKRLFAANMSHEIRTPLNVIQGNAELLGQRSLSPGHARAALEAIGRNTRHLAEVTEAILDFATIDVNSLEFHFQDFDAGEIIDFVRPLLARSAMQRGLALNMRWCGERRVAVHSDPARIRQVLLNLIGNAVRFTQTGSVSAIGFVDSSNTDGTNLHFTITDTGPGLTREQITEALEPFSQADAAATRRHGGLGLGLSIAQSIVRSLGGAIEIFSEIDVGTRFEISIPCHPATTSLPEPVSAPHEVSFHSHRKPLEGRHILLAEDCIDNQRLATTFLRKAGAEVIVVPDGAEAIRAVDERGEGFDAILMDIQMPVMDGCEATARLRAKGYTGPILAFTANATAADREACALAGCSGFITKPVSRAMLIARLAELPRPAAYVAAA